MAVYLQQVICFWFFGNCLWTILMLIPFFSPMHPLYLLLCAVVFIVYLIKRPTTQVPTPHTQHLPLTNSNWLWDWESQLPATSSMHPNKEKTFFSFSTYVHCDFSGSEKAEGGNLPFAFEVIICSVQRARTEVKEVLQLNPENLQNNKTNNN